jgi:hypothetical protein
MTANLQSQNFVEKTTAENIISQAKVSDVATLNQMDTADPSYISYKNNLRAYEIFFNHIDDVDVEESVYMAVLELREYQISYYDYINNISDDPEQLRIKDHLFALLTE